MGKSKHCTDLFLIDREGAFALALGARARRRAGTDIGCAAGANEKRSKQVAALDTVVLDQRQLRQHVGATRHHARGLDQRVQVNLTARYARIIR